MFCNNDFVIELSCFIWNLLFVCLKQNNQFNRSCEKKWINSLTIAFFLSFLIDKSMFLLKRNKHYLFIYLFIYLLCLYFHLWFFFFSFFNLLLFFYKIKSLNMCKLFWIEFFIFPKLGSINKNFQIWEIFRNSQ